MSETELTPARRSIWFKPGVIEQVKAIAEARNRSVNYVVNDALLFYIERYNKAQSTNGTKPKKKAGIR